MIPKQHGGGDDDGNLALTCVRCNLFKGPNLAGLDPETDEMVPLFHPRQEEWTTHFRAVGPAIVGLTPIGRASVRVFNMNEDRRILLREMLIETGDLD